MNEWVKRKRLFVRYFFLLTYIIRETAYQYILARLASTPTSPSHASSAAVDALASAIKLPTIFDFTSILKSQTVQTLQTHPLLDLLHIFVEKGLADLDAWENTNAATAQTYGMILLLRK